MVINEKKKVHAKNNCNIIEINVFCGFFFLISNYNNDNNNKYTGLQLLDIFDYCGLRRRRLKKIGNILGIDIYTNQGHGRLKTRENHVAAFLYVIARQYNLLL